MKNSFLVFILIIASGCASQPTRQVSSGPRLFDLPLATNLGEHKVDGEDEAIVSLQKLLIGHMAQNYSDPNTHADRAVHAKGHGCVNASFVLEEGIPAELRQGLLAQKGPFDAWIRFSNGDGPREDDSTLESRGMAVKLLGVTGTKILAGEEDSPVVDFLMADQPAFFLKNVADYADSITAREGGVLAKAKFAAAYPRELLFRNSAKRVLNPLNAQYWSKLPYQLGTKIMKFTARPCDFLPMEKPPFLVKNYMKTEMKNQLAREDACFEFFMQPRVEAPDADEVMPIEDASKIWSEDRSGYVKVAKLHIPKQDFDTDERNAFCENLSFSPWHTLREQRPLGSLNRVRKILYEEISGWRHDHNHSGPPAGTF